MLGVLKSDGDCVIRIYDVCSWRTVSILVILQSLFKRICVAKPITSYASHPERFVVCQGFLVKDERRQELIDWMSTTTNTDLHLLSPKILKKDPALLEYIRENNTTRMLKETKALKEILECIGTGLRDTKQASLREDHEKALYKHWGIEKGTINELSPSMAPVQTTAIPA